MVQVEAMFSVRKKPWHGLGTIVKEAPDSADAIRLAGLDWTVVQEVLGHKDVSTTLDIYTDVTKELARREFEDLDEKLKENMESARRRLRDSNSGENA